MNYDFYLIIRYYFSKTEVKQIYEIEAAIDKYEEFCLVSDYVELIGVKDGKEKIILSSW